MSKGTGGIAVAGGRSVGRPGGYAREQDLAADLTPPAYQDFGQDANSKPGDLIDQGRIQQGIDWARAAWPTAQADIRSSAKLEHQAIATYVGFGSESINHYLRQEKGQPDPSQEPANGGLGFSRGQYVAALDGAIGRYHTPENVVVYRGLHYNPVYKRVVADALKPGTIISDRGYVSTSLIDLAARKFVAMPGPVLMRIRLPKGTPVLPALAVSGFGEAELTLPRGSRFKVVSHDLRPSGLAVVTADWLPPKSPNHG